MRAERRAAGRDDQPARAAADYRQVEFGLRHPFSTGESYTVGHPEPRGE